MERESTAPKAPVRLVPSGTTYIIAGESRKFRTLIETQLNKLLEGAGVDSIEKLPPKTYTIPSRTFEVMDATGEQVAQRITASQISVQALFFETFHEISVLQLDGKPLTVPEMAAAVTEPEPQLKLAAEQRPERQSDFRIIEQAREVSRDVEFELRLLLIKFAKLNAGAGEAGVDRGFVPRLTRLINTALGNGKQEVVEIELKTFMKNCEFPAATSMTLDVVLNGKIGKSSLGEQALQWQISICEFCVNAVRRKGEYEVGDGKASAFLKSQHVGQHWEQLKAQASATDAAAAAVAGGSGAINATVDRALALMRQTDVPMNQEAGLVMLGEIARVAGKGTDKMDASSRLSNIATVLMGPILEKNDRGELVPKVYSEADAGLRANATRLFNAMPPEKRMKIQRNLQSRVLRDASLF